MENGDWPLEDQGNESITITDIIDGSCCPDDKMCRQKITNMAEEINIFVEEDPMGITYSHFGLKNGFCSRLLTKFLTDPNSTQDLLMHMSHDDPILFLIPKTKKQPAIQYPNDTPPPQGHLVLLLLPVYWSFTQLSSLS